MNGKSVSQRLSVADRRNGERRFLSSTPIINQHELPEPSCSHVRSDDCPDQAVPINIQAGSRKYVSSTPLIDRHTLPEPPISNIRPALQPSMAKQLRGKRILPSVLLIDINSNAVTNNRQLHDNANNNCSHQHNKIPVYETKPSRPEIILSKADSVYEIDHKASAILWRREQKRRQKQFDELMLVLKEKGICTSTRRT